MDSTLWPTSSMRLLALFVLLCSVTNAQYQLQSIFAGLTFFENFDFYTSWDPTFGYVHYVDQAVADQYDMINITESSVSWGVDKTQILNPDANLGRLSIRLTTIQSWTHGLFILDLAHMPSNTCGAWPAVWTLGSGIWPTNGEIDIVEFVNNVPNNLMALHTSPGCTVAGADETGTLISSDCGASGGITGCTVSSTTADNSGSTFNANGGGVYAMEWTSTAIRVWFFPRDAIPDSITSSKPDVGAFGIPTANFEGDCDIDAHFYNHSLVFNIDFCGQYAGNVWEPGGCPMLDATNGWQSCNDFVALNPQAFTETYWEVNYLKVYELASGAAPSSTLSLSSVTPAISTSAVSTALSGAQGRTSTPTESLAGTVPSITTGSFTATNSVLSVLSSLSTESAASASSESASSMSASLVGSATSGSSMGTSSTSMSSSLPSSLLTSALPGPVPPSSESNPGTSVGSVPVPTTFTSNSANSERLTTASCSGTTVCTNYVYVTVVATVTVDATLLRTQQAELIQKDHHARQVVPREVPGMYHGTRTTYWPEALPMSTPTLQRQRETTFSLCDFTIRDVHKAKRRKTDVACTLTRDEIFTGTLYTETLIASTSLLRDHPLDFGSLLYIQSISMTTIGAASLACTDKHTYTGNFTPSTTYAASTKLTAYLDVASAPTTSTSHSRTIMSPPPHADSMVTDAEYKDDSLGAHLFRRVDLAAPGLKYSNRPWSTLSAIGTVATGVELQGKTETTIAYSTAILASLTSISNGPNQNTLGEPSSAHSTIPPRLLSSMVAFVAMLMAVR